MNNSFYKILLCCVVYFFIKINTIYAQPGADIGEARVLCDKSLVTIEQMSGCGSDCNEAAGTCLDAAGLVGNIETNTVWFTWIAGSSNDLTFIIRPLNTGDNLSFTLFELPNGLNDGTNKITRRCVPACSFNAIGLNETDFDFAEDAACPTTNDGFLQALSMDEGIVYGLMIDNPNSTGGFTIEFGGEGEFVGPQAIIVPDATTLCFGQSITFENNSLFPAGNITGYEWIFGEDATPRQTALNSNEAQTVSYSTPGPKSVELIITTDLGCTSSTIFTDIITIDDCCESDNKITLDTTITQIACPNDSNGIIDLTVTSSFSPIIEWSNGATTEDLINLFPGTYSVTVSNEATCRDSLTYTFIVPSTLEGTDVTTPPSCGGIADGSITINAIGGRPPYQYDFEDGNGFVNNNTLTGLPIGDYQVTIRDGSGCSFLVDGIELDENELIITLENQGNPNCQNEKDGFVEISIISGLAPYEYDFNDGNGRVNEAALSMLGAGDFIIDVIDAEQCQGVFEFSLTDPDELRLILEAGRITCNGDNDGTAIATPSGGTADYTYNWSNGANSKSINSLSPGDYLVTVTDAKGCTIERMTSITEPNTLEVSIASIQDVQCPGEGSGTIELDVSGGINPYQYSIDGILFQPGTAITGLESGDYEIRVKDNNDCTVVVEATINSPESLALNVSSTSNICYGEVITFTDVSSFSRGEIVSWSWNFGNGSSPQTANGIGPHDIAFTTIGQPIIELTLRTDLNCEIVFRDTLNFLVEPCCETLNSLDLFAFSEDPLCAGGTDGAIDLDISSTPAITSIAWDNGATTEDLDNLVPGEYTVNVSNDATCESSITFLIEEPSEVMAFLNITNPSCGDVADGIILVNASGGTGTGVGGGIVYEYDFGNGFTTNNSAENLVVGQYSISIRDENNCTTTLDTSLSELVLMPSEANVIQPTCFGLTDGNIQFDIPNGVQPFLFDFNDGNGFQASDILNNLPAGNYSIQIQDADLCLSQEQQVIIDEPSPLTLSTDPSNVSCFGEGDGQIVAVVTGGVGNFSYTWSNGQIGSIATNLNPADYTVNVVDGNDCPIEGSATVTEPAELIVAVSSIQDVLCFGEMNGLVRVAVNGGNMPYSYSLDGILFQTSADIGGLSAGDYTITVRDDRGCESEINASIDEPGEFNVTAVTDKEVAQLGFPINLSAMANGGNAGINFVWSTPDSVICNNCPSLETVPPGSTTYTVLAVNSENCTATASVKVAISFDRPVYIPNAFSPNGDGINDEFFIPFTPAMISIKELRIFDRTGSLVYEAFNIDKGDTLNRGWDGVYNGTKLRYGVFLISAEISFVDGKTLPYQSDLTLFGEE